MSSHSELEQEIREQAHENVKVMAGSYSLEVTNPAIDWDLARSYKNRDHNKVASLNDVLYVIQNNIEAEEEELVRRKLEIAADMSMTYIMEYKGPQIMRGEKELRMMYHLRHWICEGVQGVYPTLDAVLDDMDNSAKRIIEQLLTRDLWRSNEPQNQAEWYVAQSLLRFYLRILQAGGRPVQFDLGQMVLKGNY